MAKKYTTLNFYFLVPFLVWVVVGGLLRMTYTRQELFSFVNGHHVPATDILMYYVTWMGEGITITLVLLLLLGLAELRNWWYFSTAFLCNLVPTGVEQWLKFQMDKPRPLNYFKQASWIHTTPEWPVLLERSFPSGHSTGAFAFFCFLALLLPAKYRWAGAVFFMMAISVCYSRMYLAAHFFDDVYAGSIIGTVFCCIVFVILNKYKSRIIKNSEESFNA